MPLKELAKAESPAEQARAIIEHAIPYRVAATVIKQMTPDGPAGPDRADEPAGVDQQPRGSPPPGRVRQSGPQGPDRGEAPGGQDRRPRQRLQGRGGRSRRPTLSDDVRRTLEQVADAQVKAKGRIERPTALLIDKSGSMSVAIELGKRIGALVSAVCAQALYVYAFDTIAYPIEAAGTDLAAWEKALKGIKAGGGTSCGVAVEMMRRKKQYVEQIIVVTDEEENTAPLFVETLKKYREEVKADPNVCFVRTPGARTHAGGAVPEGRDHGRRVPVHGRLLRAAEPGAAAVPTVEAGPADGDPGVPAAGPQAGLSDGFHRINRVPASECLSRKPTSL